MDERVVMGRVAAPYAVKGWLKVQPFTEYVDGLLDYPTWWLGRKSTWQEYRVLEGKVHGQTLLVQLEGVDDRDAAERMQGMDIAVMREELPAAEEGEYYWDDLIGLAVVNLEGVTLGKVTGLLETGAHEVLRVKDEGGEERLIPFVEAYVREVDTAAGRIEVDWGLDY